MKAISYYIIEKQEAKIFDFDTEKGRNHIAKVFWPEVIKIANSEEFSSFNTAELIGAGSEGLAKAIASYKDEKNKKGNKGVKQYIMYYIRWKILDYINNEGETVHVPKSQHDKKQYNINYGNLEAGDEIIHYDDVQEPDYKWHNKVIDDTHDPSNVEIVKQSEKEIWEEICKELKKKFSERDINIFLDYFGKYGHKEIQGKEIAQKNNLSQSNITYIIQKIAKYLRDVATPLANKLQKIYSESYNKYIENKIYGDM